jgi:tetratricopeptide (TPR) repeat protein
MSNETRISSPPPHILGQIVEMGFTPHQARVALAATDTGVNVEAALESLLAVGEDFTSSEPYRRLEHPRSSQRSRQTTRDSIEILPSRPSGSSTPASVAGLQPDKLLAQASEIGLSMFSKANSFWNQGKEAVQKAYEESLKTTGTPSAPADGRPKWMTGDTAEPITPDAAKTTFKDDSDVSSPANLKPEPSSRSRSVAQPSASTAPSQSARNLLFEDEAPAYVSPHRRKPAASSSRTDIASATLPARRAAPSPRPPPQPSRPKIVVPETSSAAMASCVSSRTKGTEFFKLGQYADAESAYTTAITAIPTSHILLTSLYTNRAAARLKTGDSGGAVGDCTNVLKLIGVADDMSGLLEVEDGKVWEFDGVPGKLDLREQAVKALQRRAAGLEMMERWDRARADWERLAGLNWTQAQGRVKEEATRSAARCRTLVNAATRAGDAHGSSAPVMPRPAKPKPRAAPPRRSGPTGPSEASKRLKQAEQALENEENERIQLKDSVDARIQGWKGGKEANIRALIASLETVLWPELGWVKVGMHELVTPSQVKIRYTKAIAKVHPDKVFSLIFGLGPFGLTVSFAAEDRKYDSGAAYVG